jgi:hypothetical protein
MNEYVSVSFDYIFILYSLKNVYPTIPVPEHKSVNVSSYNSSLFKIYNIEF